MKSALPALTGVLLGTVVLAPLNVRTATPRPPNVVAILTDDRKR